MKKLEKNWARWKEKKIEEGDVESFSGVGTLRGRYFYDTCED